MVNRGEIFVPEPDRDLGPQFGPLYDTAIELTKTSSTEPHTTAKRYILTDSIARSLTNTLVTYEGNELRRATTEINVDGYNLYSAMPAWTFNSEGGGSLKIEMTSAPDLGNGTSAPGYLRVYEANRSSKRHATLFFSASETNGIIVTLNSAGSSSGNHYPSEMALEKWAKVVDFLGNKCEETLTKRPMPLGRAARRVILRRGLHMTSPEEIEAAILGIEFVDPQQDGPANEPYL